MTYKEPTLINGQPLSFYLTHPGALKQVDKGVLQTLVVKYPYSAHLHLLLAIKDHLDNGIVSQDLLEKAALYIPDRKKLGEWMNKLQNLRRSDAYGPEHLEALAEQSVPEDIVPQEDRHLIDPEIVATEHYEDDEFPTPEALEKIEEPLQTTETTWEESDLEDEEHLDEQLAGDEELADISDEFSTEGARADLQAQVGEEITEPEDLSAESVAEIDSSTGEEATSPEIIIQEPVFESLPESDDPAVDTYEETIAEELPESEWDEMEELHKVEEDDIVATERKHHWEEEEEEEEEEVKGQETREDEKEIEEEQIAEEIWREEQEGQSLDTIEDAVPSEQEVEGRVPPDVPAFDRATDEKSRPEIESPSTPHVYLDQEAEDLPETHTPAASLESSETADSPDTGLILDTETLEDFTDHDSPFLNWLHRLSGTEAGGFEELSEVKEEEESRSSLSPMDEEKESKKKKKKDKKKRKKDKKKKKKKKKKKRWEEESLRTDEALVSEALAEILANQGHYDRAIEMYNRLRLIIPEKSVFFAQKIEELESKK